tara:strand:+ start:801 stop:2201 length:1401 start_codon:yes stop_codon:yes gene_type:complete
MPTKLILTYDTSNKCYIKWYRDKLTGKRRKIYLGRSPSKYNKHAYSRALARWRDFESQIENNSNALPTEQLATPKRIEKATRSKNRPLSTAAGVYDKYVESIYLQVQNKTKGNWTYLVVKSQLNRFMEFLGPKKHWDNSKVIHKPPRQSQSGVNACLNNERLIGYKKYLDRLIRDETLSRTTAKAYFASVKRFYMWAWENEYIKELPRKYYSRDLRFKVRIDEEPNFETSVPLFTNEELKQILSIPDKHSPNSLLILLALNCGWTAVELATFQIKHIERNALSDGSNEYIIQKSRTKTKVMGSWRLWDELGQALEYYLQYRHGKSWNRKEHELVFTTNDGRPLVHTKSGNKRRKVQTTTTIRHDAVYMRLYSRMRKLKMTSTKRSFKTLRKQGATAIQNITLDKGVIFTQMYLAHAPTDMASKHYAKKNPEMLYPYIDQIPKELDIEKELTEVTKYYRGLLYRKDK